MLNKNIDHGIFDKKRIVFVLIWNSFFSCNSILMNICSLRKRIFMKGFAGGLSSKTCQVLFFAGGYSFCVCRYSF
jgi:hypothetical protein